MKKKIKKDIIIYIVIFILTLITYSGYVSMHYAADTYNIMNIGYTQYAINNSLIDGRIIMGILDILADCINMPINIAVVGSTIISLLVSCLAVIILKNMILELRKVESKFLEIITIIISYITIFNFMYVENLYFIEAIVMSISILMYILAIKEIMQKEKFYYIKALIMAIIATFCYQGTIGLFLAYSFVFTIIKNKESKKDIIKDLTIILSIAFIAFILNLIQINVATNIFNMETKRIAGMQKILLHIKNMFTHFTSTIFYKIFINCCGLFPNALLIVFVFGIIATSIAYEIKYKNEKILIKIIEIIVVIILITIAMSIVGLNGYASGRIQNQVGALIGLIYIFLFCNTEIFNKNDKIKLVITGILLIYTFITITNTFYLLTQHKIVNKLEEEQCKELEEYIKEYEEKNNVKITEAKYFKINNTKYYFSNIPNKSVLTYNGVACSWSSIGTINFYTNRHFKNEQISIKDNEEIIKKYLKLMKEGYNNNFVIIDNILYYTVFI